MPIADAIREAQSKGSWIRKMFEEGALLKQRHGAAKVFDFSIGNPDIEPPRAFHEVLVRLAAEDAAGSHGYMPNAGFPDVRAKLAAKVSAEHGIAVEGKHLTMTVGAAGGLNVVLKSVLNPGDEVVVVKPYFVEYGAYIANHGGKMVLVDAAADFGLDVPALAAALTPRTAAVLINSPHNPTGRVYPAAAISALAAALEAHGRRSGRKPYLIADEPYREIVYDGLSVPPVLSAYAEAIVATSYSKSLSLPGERIGYIAVNPAADAVEELLGALAYSTRVLGYVNAPALMQRAVAELVGARVEVEVYARRRAAFQAVLDAAGIEYSRPEGAFYLFCKVPPKRAGAAGTGDDIEFVQFLKDQLILAVPGTGFGAPGWFRLAYCVDEASIRGSGPGFKAALAAWRA
jgi:aspartate aminotransferase